MSFTNFSTVIAIYIFAALLTAFFYYQKSSKKNFLEHLLSSFVAISLLPLFLSTVGNESIHFLLNYAVNTETSSENGKYYILLVEVYSYAVLVGMAGNTIIYKVLSGFLSDQELKSLKAETKEIAVESKEFVKTYGEREKSENRLKDVHFHILNSLYGQRLFMSKADMPKDIAQDDIEYLLSNKLIKAGLTETGESSYKITAIGKLLLDEKE